VIFVDQCHVPTNDTYYCVKCASRQKCPKCTRRLQDGLYTIDPSGIVCNSCVRGRQHGRGRTSVNRTFVSDSIDVPANTIDPVTFIRQQESALGDSLKATLLSRGSVKWYPASVYRFTRSEPEGEARVDARFTAPPQILLREDEITAQVTLAINTMLSRGEDFVEHGSDSKLTPY